MPGREIFWEDWKDFSVGTTETNYDFDQVETNWMLRIESIAVYNSHSTQTLDCYFGILTGDVFLRVEGAKALAAGDVFERRRPTWIKELDRLRVALKGSGSATTGRIYAQGWLIEQK